MAMPVGISPTALQKLAHQDGELATARAAEKAQVIYIQSTMSTYSIEEVAQAAPKAIKWFQLYIYKERNVSESLIRRAEASNYKAIVLTVDIPKSVRRYADQRNNWVIPSTVV